MASSPAPPSVTPKPLMLKDLIRDDPEDFEFILGDKSETLRGLFRTCKLSSVLNAVRLLPFFSSSSSSSPTCRHKVLRRRFWKKRPVAVDKSENHCNSLQETETDRDISTTAGRLLIRDIIRSESFAEEMRGIRSRFSSDNSVIDWFDFTVSDDSVSTSQSPEKANNGIPTVGPSTAGNSDSVETSNNRHHDRQKEDRTQTKECSCHCHQYEEEKDQFSPVSVMDFLSEEDEEPAQSPSPSESPTSSFHHNLAKFENTWKHLIKKIGRFETLAKVQEDMEEEEEEEEEEDGGEVVRELLKKTRTEVKCNDKLLLDFFVQEMREGNRTEEDLLSAARDWIKRAGTRGDGDVELNMKEIEREMRFRCIHVAGREDIAAEVEHGVFVSIIDDLLLDLMDF